MAIVPHFCQWLYATHFGTAIRESTYAFPIIETIHTLGIMVLVGTVSVLGLRLLGVSMKQAPVSRLFSQILPWTWSGFVVMVITGILLFASEARDDYANNAFRLKLALLLLVGVNPLIFHTTIFKSVQTWDLAKVTPLRARVAAVLSLCLWAGIIVTGRLIAYAHN
jgi:hypothetical protein